MLDQPLLLIFPLAMAFAGAMDLFTLRIPNRISLTLVAGFVIVALSSKASWTLIGSHVAVGAVVLVFAMLLWGGGYLGGGDAKILSAAALWFGPDLLASYVVLVTFLGGLLAYLMICYRDIDLLPRWLLRQGWALRLHERGCGIPYGLALGGAGLALYPRSTFFMAFAA